MKKFSINSSTEEATELDPKEIAKRPEFIRHLNSYGTDFSVLVRNPGVLSCGNLTSGFLFLCYKEFMRQKVGFTHGREEGDSKIFEILKIHRDGEILRGDVVFEGNKRILGVQKLEVGSSRLPMLLKVLELRLKQQLSYVHELYSEMIKTGAIDKEFLEEDCIIGGEESKKEGINVEEELQKEGKRVKESEEVLFKKINNEFLLKPAATARKDATRSASTGADGKSSAAGTTTVNAPVTNVQAPVMISVKALTTTSKPLISNTTNRSTKEQASSSGVKNKPLDNAKETTQPKLAGLSPLLSSGSKTPVPPSAATPSNKVDTTVVPTNKNSVPVIRTQPASALSSMPATPSQSIANNTVNQTSSNTTSITDNKAHSTSSSKTDQNNMNTVPTPIVTSKNEEHAVKKQFTDCKMTEAQANSHEEMLVVSPSLEGSVEVIHPASSQDVSAPITDNNASTGPSPINKPIDSIIGNPSTVKNMPIDPSIIIDNLEGSGMAPAASNKIKGKASLQAQILSQYSDYAEFSEDFLNSIKKPCRTEEKKNKGLLVNSELEHINEESTIVDEESVRKRKIEEPVMNMEAEPIILNKELDMLNKEEEPVLNSNCDQNKKFKENQWPNFSHKAEPMNLNTFRRRFDSRISMPGNAGPLSNSVELSDMKIEDKGEYPANEICANEVGDAKAIEDKASSGNKEIHISKVSGDDKETTGDANATVATPRIENIRDFVSYYLSKSRF